MPTITLYETNITYLVLLSGGSLLFALLRRRRGCAWNGVTSGCQTFLGSEESENTATDCLEAERDMAQLAVGEMRVARDVAGIQLVARHHLAD